MLLAGCKRQTYPTEGGRVMDPPQITVVKHSKVLCSRDFTRAKFIVSIQMPEAQQRRYGRSTACLLYTVEQLQIIAQNVQVEYRRS